MNGMSEIERQVLEEVRKAKNGYEIRKATMKLPDPKPSTTGLKTATSAPSKSATPTEKTGLK